MFSAFQASARGDSPSTIFYSIAAQPDNLGDVEIRKVVLDWILSTGQDVEVFVGAMPEAYIRAFCIPERVEICTSNTNFQLRLLKKILRREAHLAFAPGPHTLRHGRGKWPQLGKQVVNLANSVLTKLAGGKVLVIGRAVRGTDRAGVAIEWCQARVSDAYCVRDPVSAAVVKSSASIIPDVAFFNVNLQNSENTTRKSVIISMRGDRNVDPLALVEFARSVSDAGREPVLVTQVARDDERHAELAQQIGCRLVPWGANTHAQQMEIVKTEYSRAAMVVSDRLHALIFGLQFGAAPVAIVHPGEDKLTSTLSHVVEFRQIDSQSKRWPNAGSLLISSSPQTREAAIAAKGELDALRTRVVALLAT